jgi:hypothetical protein
MTDFSNFNPRLKVYSEKKVKPVKSQERKPTGELELFKKIYEQRKGICAITKEWVPFHVESFMHVLSKGAFPSFRLEEYNILLVQREVHRLYDNSSREKLLEKYPSAVIIYDLKDALKQRYKWYADNKKFNNQP